MRLQRHEREAWLTPTPEMALSEVAPSAAVERLLREWLPTPTKAEVAASYTHHSHPRRYRSREAPLKFALQRIGDDGAQRPVMQQWLEHIERACPGRLYLPRYLQPPAKR